MFRERGRWGARARLSWACVAIVLVSCSPQPRSAIDGVAVFDDFITLERGTARDTARREFTASADATFVGVLVEDDVEVQLQIERLGSGEKPLASVVVESRMDGEGIEVAALDVKRGERLLVKLEGPQDFEMPGRIRLKLLRYDASIASPPVRARVQALRDWTAATASDMSADGMRATGYGSFDAALAHLESPDGDPNLAAWARLVRATASHAFSIDQKASLADARRATQTFSKLGDARNTARARFAAALALLEISTDAKSTDPKPADAMRESMATLRELEGDASLSPRERARNTAYLGINFYYEKDFPETIRLTQKSLEAFRAIGDRDGIRTSLANLGVYAGETGDWQESARVFDELLPRVGELQLPERRLAYIDNDAYAHMSSGNTDVAVELYLRVLKEAREYKLPWYEARALEGLGRSYWERGDLAQGAVYIEEGGKVRRKLDDPGGLMVNKSMAGSIARDSGDPRKALPLHREALTMAVTNDARMRGMANVARDLAAAGEFYQAVATYREALALPQSQAIPWRIRSVGLYLAESLLARKGRNPRDVDEALSLAQTGLEGAVADGDISQELTARKVLAQARAARGDIAEARREYESAIALIFRYRAMTASAEQQAVTLTRLQDTFRGYTDLLMRKVVERGPGKMLPAGDDETNALRVLESARVIGFDAVRLARVDAATQNQIDQLLARMATKRVALAGQLDRPNSSAAAVAALKLEIADLRARIDTEGARGNSAKAGDRLPPDVTRPWPAIAAGVTQLSYALGARNAYLWVRDAAGIRVTVLAPSPSSIEREIDRLAPLLRATSAVDSAKDLERISSWLLPKDALAIGSTRLEIVAEGKIASVPFAALIAPGSPARRLAQSHSIVMIGSILDGQNGGTAAGAHAVRLVLLEAGNGLAAARGTRAVFPSLASTRSEARAIVALFERGAPASGIKLLSGAGGSSEAVKAAWTQGAGVFHFATHGLADLRQPLASLLMLPTVDSSGNPTYLTAGQVQSWNGAADLVYLSACDTAVGPARFADGIPGLQRAFLRAGARGVIATLWPIEDVYAVQFATEFYGRYTAGTAAAQALGETQRAWLAPPPTMSAPEQARRRMTAWAHAYYTR